MELIHWAVCGSGSNYFLELQLSIVAGLTFQVVAVMHSCRMLPPITCASNGICNAAAAQTASHARGSLTALPTICNSVELTFETLVAVPASIRDWAGVDRPLWTSYHGLFCLVVACTAG